MPLKWRLGLLKHLHSHASASSEDRSTRDISFAAGLAVAHPHIARIERTNGRIEDPPPRGRILDAECPPFSGVGLIPDLPLPPYADGTPLDTPPAAEIFPARLDSDASSVRITTDDSSKPEGIGAVAEHANSVYSDAPSRSATKSLTFAGFQAPSPPVLPQLVGANIPLDTNVRAFAFANSHSTTGSRTMSQGTIRDSKIGNILINHVAGDQHNTYNYRGFANPSNSHELCSLPEPVLTAIQEHPHLLSILGVAIAFRLPGPSVLQISRILQLGCKEVVDALQSKAISSLFDPQPVDLSLNVKILPDFGRALVQRTGKPRVLLPKYHDMIARWCLAPKLKHEPRDTLYAAEFWAFHVCMSTSASSELYDALRSSWIPTDPVSREELGNVIDWLEEQDTAEASELLIIYKEVHARDKEDVIVGGMLRMSF
ncbi:hypothetical protein GGX14DRAFT_582797 [Mycena pura]|uniref:Uncharacterized protein n=1 Tax=Mycena pura TaxID=153505 RepID=A0AAD7E6I7_9AGAR|nr:hypothetical protein GGX14DRAFT_582797 [Mycena pura]